MFVTEAVPVGPIRQYPMVAQQRAEVTQGEVAVGSDPLPGIQRVSDHQNVLEGEGVNPSGGDRGVR